MYQKNEPGDLLAKVLELLADRPRSMTYSDIVLATKLPEPWLKALASGQIKDPSVNRVEILYTYLTGNPLNV